MNKHEEIRMMIEFENASQGVFTENQMNELRMYFLQCEATEKELEQLQKKETPMKPKGSWNLCPNCNEELLSGHDLQSQFMKHCWNCGQKLDWSD